MAKSTIKRVDVIVTVEVVDDSGAPISDATARKEARAFVDSFLGTGSRNGLNGTRSAVFGRYYSRAAKVRFAPTAKP